MNLHREGRSLHIFIVFFCGCLTAAAAATEPPFNSTANADFTSGEPVSSATPPPGGTVEATEPTGVGGTTEAVTPNSEADTTWTVSETPAGVTEAPSATTGQPVVTSEGNLHQPPLSFFLFVCFFNPACSCDLTPGFCDIGCCCDTVDCDVANLSTIFTGCTQKAISGVCVEKWLMFRANVDSSLVTLTDTLFCIQTKGIMNNTFMWKQCIAMQASPHPLHTQHHHWVHTQVRPSLLLTDVSFRKGNDAIFYSNLHVLFSLSSGNCSELRSHIYTIMQGPAPPDVIAMNFGSQPDWARVLNHKCPISLQETCESGCTLPYFLSIRVLWARQGLLDLPQNHILGAKYLFQCKTLKCPVSSPITLTTEVTFADTTVYPEPPRGAPQPEWKFPFSFFTQGAAELDGHVVINGTEKVTWSLMLFTLMLLMGLEFFTR
uniref:Uncharacterized protein n=1 Tax=Mola mola TaxID=94237 RepID=A0A3Q3VKN8_MOLML